MNFSAKEKFIGTKASVKNRDKRFSERSADTIKHSDKAKKPRHQNNVFWCLRSERSIKLKI
jgi:hypothetical protein